MGYGDNGNKVKKPAVHVKQACYKLSVKRISQVVSHSWVVTLSDMLGTHYKPGPVTAYGGNEEKIQAWFISRTALCR